MSKELIERLRNTTYHNLDPYEAADRIEQLSAQLKEAQVEAAHWKNNHETEVRRARILKERTDMPIERVAAYEQWGKDQLALKEAQAEIEQWKANSRENKLIAEQMAEPYKREIAASQAREQQLREALHYSLGAWHYDGVSDEHGSIFKEANDRCDSPSDTAALEAMIQKAGEVMRERSMNACSDRSIGTDPDDFDAWDHCNYSCAEAIRALPGVRLEDLK